MILCIGEILADMIGRQTPDATVFSRYPGGAPFNVACTLRSLGVSVGFCGRVGDDLIGSYLRDFAEERGFDCLALQVDTHHNTTLAFVELDGSGERSFCFYRKGTADYRLDTTALESLIAEADIVHLGSLMISEPEGRAAADRIIELTRRQGKRLSFDVNFRDDIFESTEQAVALYRHYAAQADIVKYSEEEAMQLTDTDTLEEAVAVLKATRGIHLITLGRAGSLCVYNGEVYRKGSIEVVCVDTTGAGDAFLAGALSVLDRCSDDTPASLTEALCVGNICGAVATTEYGAIPAGLNGEAIRRYREKCIDRKYVATKP